MVKVPKGTRIQIAFDDKLSSGSNVSGDAFVATVVEDVVRNGDVRIPEGSRILGTVQEVKKAKRGAGEASMTLKFEQLEMSRGYSAPIVAGFSESTESKKKRNAAVIGGSAAGGALVGRVLGKDTKGAVIGGLVGGAIGTGVILAKPGEQVEIPAGSQVEIKLNQPVSVPVR